MVLAMDKFYCIVFLYILLNFALNDAAPKSALIRKLPGFNGTFPSKHYSGYVTIGAPPKKLFYYFVVSERNPSKDAVVLWLNGGPGCSSFDGFVYEHDVGYVIIINKETQLGLQVDIGCKREGDIAILEKIKKEEDMIGPFNFEAGKQQDHLPTLHLNPYSWSKVSSVIYLDSPVGVGFSYSRNTSIYVTSDLQTASDTLKFLLKWFQTFPEFVSNPFYIAGESYAGVFVPTLASEVVKGIKARTKPVINFKGYLIGNGVTDDKFDGDALIPFAHGMGLISDDIYKEVNAACRGSYYNANDFKCNELLSKVNDILAELNIYDILEPCYHNPNMREAATGNTSVPMSFKQLGQTERPLPVRKRMFGRAWPFQAPIRDGIVPLWPRIMNKAQVACINDEVAVAWLNDEAVRKAIHAAPESEVPSWELCTDRLLFNHDAGSMIKYHKNLTTHGYRALIFSGDHDMCVPFTGSQAWTRSLGYKIVDEWRSWKSNNQVAGFLQGYDHNLTFITIKGAGHTVPEYKPREALHFYSRWLEGRSI